MLLGVFLLGKSEFWFLLILFRFWMTNYPLNTSTWKFTFGFFFYSTYLAFVTFLPLSCFPQSPILKILEKCLTYLSSFPSVRKVNKFYGFCIGIISPLSVAPWMKHLKGSLIPPLTSHLPGPCSWSAGVISLVTPLPCPPPACLTSQ